MLTAYILVLILLEKGLVLTYQKEKGLVLIVWFWFHAPPLDNSSSMQDYKRLCLHCSSLMNIFSYLEWKLIEVHR
jgi:hypothetical protein